MEPLAAVAAVGALATAAAAAGVLVAATPRRAILGLALGLVFAPLAMSPLPSAQPAGFWLVATLLAAYLLMIAVREAPASLPAMPLGGLVEAAFVVLGLALGWAVAPVAGPDRGASSALAAGVAVAFAAVPLAAFSRDALRTGIAGVLAFQAAALLVAGFAGTPGAAVVVAFAIAILAAATGARSVIRLESRARAGVRPAAPVRHDPTPHGTARHGPSPHGDARTAGSAEHSHETSS